MNTDKDNKMADDNISSRDGAMHENRDGGKENRDVGRDRNRRDGGDRRRGGNRRDDEKDLIESVVSVRRVTKIVRGGSRFSFSVLAIVGDQNGKIGWGKGKDRELNNAKIKALRKAKKSLVHVSLRHGRTIHHDIKYKYGSSVVVLKSAKLGTGMIAGGVLRSLFDCVGVKDIVAKAYGSTNTYNMLFAGLESLRLVANPRRISDRRGIKPGLVIARKNKKITSI